MSLAHWWAGARPKTLPAAVVPVVVGTAAASATLAQAGEGAAIIWWRAVAAMVVALALQVATNYVNDYADGERGTDHARVGPVRLVAGGLATASQVRRAALGAFAVAGMAGGLLAWVVGPELLLVGAASMVAGWAYTGGPKPYGYHGMGELFVFVFFGMVATVGSSYVQTESVTGLSTLASVPVGLLAVALLVINNLRDIPTDLVSGKRTLAVRIGDPATRKMYVGLLVAVALGILACGLVRPWALLGLAGLTVGIGPARAVMAGAGGHDLIPLLAATGRTQLVTGALLALGLVMG